MVQIALAVLFGVMGLQLLGLRGAFFTDAGDVSKAVYHLFGRGDIGNIVKIAVGVVFLLFRKYGKHHQIHRHPED